MPCPVLHRIAFAVVSEWYQESVDFTDQFSHCQLFFKLVVDYIPSTAAADCKDVRAHTRRSRVGSIFRILAWLRTTGSPRP
jgi:hypothetical protein